MNQTITWAKLPSAGLGNKLFVWANAQIFARNNQIPCVTTGWTKLHIGPWLRGEKSKRFYFSYFRGNKVKLLIKFFFLKRYKVHHLPSTACTNFYKVENGVICFSEVPHWRDWFYGIRENHQFIKEKFFSSLHQNIQKEVEDFPIPFASIHVRMGDFRKLKESEDFSKVGAVRTPLEYFIKTIQKVRQFAGWDFPVTIFSDGTEKELEELLMINNVKMAPEAKDIVHLVSMSKSKIIILSAGSSFSQWAGFLSDGIILNHFQHHHSRIRPNHKKYFEGTFNPYIDPIIEEPFPLDQLLELKKHQFQFYNNP